MQQHVLNFRNFKQKGSLLCNLRQMMAILFTFENNLLWKIFQKLIIEGTECYFGTKSIFFTILSIKKFILIVL